MNQRLTRRRFGQLVIAGAAAAGIGTLATRSLAQTQPEGLVGVRPSRFRANTATPNAATPSAPAISAAVDSGGESLATDIAPTVGADASSAAIAKPSPGLVVDSLDLTGRQFQEQRITQDELQTTSQAPDGATQILEPYSQVSGLASLPGGTLVQVSNPVKSNEKGNPSRLTFLDTSPRTLNVLGLEQQDALESVLVTNDGSSLIGLVGRKNGTPPYRLANINRETGQISFIDFPLPADERFSNLTQCPDGTIYTTALAQQGNTSLVQLDLSQRQLIRGAQLRYNGQDWFTGLRSLACSTGGQLFALGNPDRYQSRSLLFTVNANNGEMSFLSEVDSTNITFTRE